MKLRQDSLVPKKCINTGTPSITAREDPHMTSQEQQYLLTMIRLSQMTSISWCSANIDKKRLYACDCYEVPISKFHASIATSHHLISVMNTMPSMYS